VIDLKIENNVTIKKRVFINTKTQPIIIQPQTAAKNKATNNE